MPLVHLKKGGLAASVAAWVVGWEGLRSSDGGFLSDIRRCLDPFVFFFFTSCLCFFFFFVFELRFLLGGSGRQSSFLDFMLKPVIETRSLVPGSFGFILKMSRSSLEVASLDRLTEPSPGRQPPVRFPAQHLHPTIGSAMHPARNWLRSNRRVQMRSKCRLCRHPRSLDMLLATHPPSSPCVSVVLP